MPNLRTFVFNLKVASKSFSKIFAKTNCGFKQLQAFYLASPKDGFWLHCFVITRSIFLPRLFRVPLFQHLYQGQNSSGFQWSRFHAFFHSNSSLVLNHFQVDIIGFSFIESASICLLSPQTLLSPHS